MKIGVLTFWTPTDNYGKQMQLYALQHFLRSRGHDAYLVKYYPERKKKKRSVKGIIISLCSLFMPQLRHRIRENKELQNKMYDDSTRNFRGFQRRYIRSTDCVYTSYSQLKTNPPEADVYIVGSDQVWGGPLSFDGMQGWFLNFGNKETKRIAYAASTGKGIAEEDMPAFAEMLSRFDAISVREESLRQQCIKAGYVHTQLAVDPSLLLTIEDYAHLWADTKMSSSTPYLFMYILNVSTPEEFGWQLIKPYIAHKGWQVKSVAASGYLPARELIPDCKNIEATLPEWLYLMHNASAVVTSSFHGVAFSIIMHRPFLAVLLTNSFSKGNARLTCLLEQVGLESRILNHGKPLEEQMDAPIDWNSVDRKLASFRQTSVDFLLKNIEA